MAPPLAPPPHPCLHTRLCPRLQVTRGVMYTREEAEGKRLRHPFDTITGACRRRPGTLLDVQSAMEGLPPTGLRWPLTRPLPHTAAEGIGINRLSHNFARAHVDGAFKGTDAEAVEMVGGPWAPAGLTCHAVLCWAGAACAGQAGRAAAEP